jgi:polyisoprenoid-binding protein YceI
MPLNVRDARVHVSIHTEGALAFLGHDRTFDVPLQLTIDGATDDTFDGVRIQAEGDVRNARLLGEVSDKDRKEIISRKDKEVLHTDRFPTLRFEGVYMAGEGMIKGTLTLHGVTQPVFLPVTVQAAAGGTQVAGRIELDLSTFGVRPYKALLGGLKVKTVVTVDYAALVHEA